MFGSAQCLSARAFHRGSDRGQRRQQTILPLFLPGRAYSRSVLASLLLRLPMPIAPGRDPFCPFSGALDLPCPLKTTLFQASCNSGWDFCACSELVGRLRQHLVHKVCFSPCVRGLSTGLAPPQSKILEPQNLGALYSWTKSSFERQWCSCCTSWGWQTNPYWFMVLHIMSTQKVTSFFPPFSEAFWS